MSKPLKNGQFVLEFLKNFENLINLWPADTKMSLVQIANKTGSSLHFIFDSVSDVLTCTTDIHEPLTYREAERMFGLLKQRLQVEIENYRRQVKQDEDRTNEAYVKIMEKIRGFESLKNWKAAYNTLNYFFSLNEKYLSKTDTISICNDCLRLGLKSKANFQELVRFINKYVCLKPQSKEKQ